jgi:hypothetical protein
MRDEGELTAQLIPKFGFDVKPMSFPVLLLLDVRTDLITERERSDRLE